MNSTDDTFKSAHPTGRPVEPLTGDCDLHDRSAVSPLLSSPEEEEAREGASIGTRLMEMAIRKHHGLHRGEAATGVRLMEDGTVGFMDVRMTGSTFLISVDHGISMRSLRDALHLAEVAWPARRPNCTVYLRGPVGVLVSQKTGTIIGVGRRDDVIAARPSI